MLLLWANLIVFLPTSLSWKVNFENCLCTYDNTANKILPFLPKCVQNEQIIGTYPISWPANMIYLANKWFMQTGPWIRLCTYQHMEMFAILIFNWWNFVIKYLTNNQHSWCWTKRNFSSNTDKYFIYSFATSIHRLLLCASAPFGVRINMTRKLLFKLLQQSFLLTTCYGLQIGMFGGRLMNLISI